MFQLRFTTKREIALWLATIEDLKIEVKRLHREIAGEKSRADAAINLLLAKTQGAIIERRSQKHDSDVPDYMGSALIDMFDETETPIKREIDGENPP